MIKLTIKYKNFDGEDRVMDAHFHLTELELTELQVSEDGGLINLLQKIVKEEDNRKLVELFKKVILMSFGKKSEDGERFIKDPEITKAFSQTAAFPELFMSLLENEDRGVEFMNGILPAGSQRLTTEELLEKAKEEGLLPERSQ